MLPLVGKPASIGESFLFVFDFDDTIIRGNSDELIPVALGVGDSMKAAYFNPFGRPQWTDLLSSTMSPFSREDVSNVIPKALKMEPAMQELFNLLERLRKAPAPVLVNTPKSGIEHAKAVTLDYVIASDANDLFISESFKQLLGIDLPADRIFSNPFIELEGDDEDKTKKSRIDWNMPAGTNNCPHCSTVTPNMCKSTIVQTALNNAAHHLTDVTLVYVGNGSNDACPIRNVLRARDHALILKGDKLETVMQRPVKYAPLGEGVPPSFPQALWADGGAGICNHHIWATADELLSCVSDLLGQNPTPLTTSNPMVGAIHPPLPPLALFDGEDGITTEFRIKRLWNDIPSLYDRLIISVQEVIEKLESKDNSSTYAEGELEVLLQGWRLGKDRIALQRKSLFKGSPSWKPLLSTNTNPSTYNEEEMKVELPKDAASWIALIESQDILPVPQQLRNFGDHWTQTPWLNGEIYMNILHWHVLQQAIRTTISNSTSSADVASWSVDGITSSALPTINIRTSNNNEPIVEVSQTPAIDIYATEKDTAINAFALTHIFPMVSIVFGDIELTKKAISNQDDVALRALVTKTVESLLMACTWGNAVDLAMFSNEELAARHLNKKDDKKHECESSKRTASEQAQRAKMATDNIPAMAKHIVSTLLGSGTTKTTAAASSHRYIDIVQDNCGVECCADMLFALYITQVSALLLENQRDKGHCAHPLTVRLHTKPVSYFVSDVMPKDIDRMLESWDESAQPTVVAASKLFRENLVHFDGREEGHVASGGERPLIEIHSHPFWVYPAENADMPPSLARQFFYSKKLRSIDDTTSASSAVEVVVPRSELVIFKGDLNFRRVCGDRHWNRDMFFKLTQLERFAQGVVSGGAEESALVNVPVPFTSVLEHYWPYNDVPIAALRTNKSELCVGVTTETMDRLDAEVGPAGWRFSGSYAVALFASSTHH